MPWIKSEFTDNEDHTKLFIEFEDLKTKATECALELIFENDETPVFTLLEEIPPDGKGGLIERKRVFWCRNLDVIESFLFGFKAALENR